VEARIADIEMHQATDPDPPAGGDADRSTAEDRQQRHSRPRVEARAHRPRISGAP
jgi:hypothetical protein